MVGEIWAFFHLPGDIDALGPVVAYGLSQGGGRIRVATTSEFSKREDARRLFRTLAVSPLELDGDKYDDWARRLPECRVLITASETSLKPHKAAHALSLALKAHGVRIFTLQHGFENVGLSYFDAIQGTEVHFAADKIFIWGRPEMLPPSIPKENLTKVVSVGRPAFRNEREVRLGADEDPGAFNLAIFENLHWHRFSEAYRTITLDEISRVCFERPNWRIVLKPHPQGRWFTQRYKGPRPKAENLTIADPAAPAWSNVSGSEIIARSRKVLTTPSTIALDAAQAGKPVAVFGYDIPLPLYKPLPIIASPENLDEFLQSDDPGASQAFLNRAIIKGDASARVWSYLLAELGLESRKE